MHWVNARLVTIHAGVLEGGTETREENWERQRNGRRLS